MFFTSGPLQQVATSTLRNGEPESAVVQAKVGSQLPGVGTTVLVWSWVGFCCEYLFHSGAQ
ncbi:MAG: hypothetical protein EP343_30150 [Deltaproteobacteria bacterium]|nr:MAG: hypothetical protein EP343_30150 [Deltaproteobacteria bacterium]